MRFKNINEFRSALSGLIAGANPRPTKAKSKAKSNGVRARNNMGFKVTDKQGNVYHADTFEEFMRLREEVHGIPAKGSASRSAGSSMGVAGFQAPIPQRAAAAGGKGGKTPKSAQPREKAPRKAFVVAPQRRGDPVSPAQGALIQAAVGGKDKFCVNLTLGTGRTGQVTGADILNELGLRYGTASDVIAEMVAAHVTNGKTEQGREHAREILMRVGNISCQFKSNPRRNPRKQSW